MGIYFLKVNLEMCPEVALELGRSFFREAGGTNCYLGLHCDGLTGLGVFCLFVIKSDGDNKNRTKNNVKSE